MHNTTSIISNSVSLLLLLGVCVWVFLDARAIGDDRGRAPGIVNTKPGVWAGSVFLMLIIALPVYLAVRLRYKRQLAERRAHRAARRPPEPEPAAEIPGVWPPPPKRPMV